MLCVLNGDERGQVPVMFPCSLGILRLLEVDKVCFFFGAADVSLCL